MAYDINTHMPLMSKIYEGASNDKISVRDFIDIRKKAVHSLEMHNRFIYQAKSKASVIEYKDEIIDGYRVITYRDINESTSMQANYLRNMKNDNKSYTPEGFEKAKYFFGVLVLQTSIEDKTPEEIYNLYKKRWCIETFYNYFKTRQDIRHYMQRIITKHKVFHS